MRRCDTKRKSVTKGEEENKVCFIADHKNQNCVGVCVGIVVWGVVDQSYDRIHKDEAQFYERKRVECTDTPVYAYRGYA